MGLIKAALNSVNSVLGDQWREYFYCDSLSDNVLVAKGVKRTGNKSSNSRGADNIITNGSVIVVNEGQCMMIVDQGTIVEFAAEPGEFTWNSSTEPSIFYGGLGEGLKGSWETLKRRFTFGGDTAKDQRVYYFNLKEIKDNKFGSPSPIPFRIVDNNIGLDLDTEVRCNGMYSYKITNPMLFYKNVCGNVSGEYTRDLLESMMKTEFITALQPALGEISAQGIRYSEITRYPKELAAAMNTELSAEWNERRGISVVSVAINPITLPEDVLAQIRTLQTTAVYRNAGMAGAAIVGAQAEAMKAAANNPNGAMMGFMGMNMAQNAGGMNAAQLFQMDAQQRAAAPAPAPAPAAPAANGWTCACGAVVTGKFCPECGSKKPDDGWTCSCGNVNKGKFCTECGGKKPENAPLYRCDKCGWEPADPKNPPRFCPECGDPFNTNDQI